MAYKELVKEFFFPFTFKEGFHSAKIRLAYYQQIVDIGGYSITNYGKDVKIEDLPEEFKCELCGVGKEHFRKED